jgi:uncharacterized membrane protein YgdD (TMEM256/DUF423 family)
MSGWFWIRTGAILGFLAVAIGAFGAHGFKVRLDSLGTAANYQTAVQYHMYHALALLAVGLVAIVARPSTPLSVAGWGFLVGAIVFSGSLYILALSGEKWLGRITPIGGLAMLIGWAAFALATYQISSPASTAYAEAQTLKEKSGP